jgi:hypothetical protein
MYIFRQHFFEGSTKLRAIPPKVRVPWTLLPTDRCQIFLNLEQTKHRNEETSYPTRVQNVR